MMKNSWKNLFLTFIFFVAGTSGALAADLILQSSSSNYSVDSSFSVDVYVASPDQSVNAVSGSVSFDNDKVNVSSVSKSGSLISFWVQEPSFSNQTGKVDFEGIILNPGFIGAKGKILTINFKSKNPGTANFNFSSGSILANDGTGTNVLKNLIPLALNFNLSGESISQSTSPSIVVGTPVAPQIFSSTHIDPNKWYSSGDVSLSWQVPSDVLEVKTLIGKIPNATPTVGYIPVISSKDIKDLDDGVWYFHVQFRNKNGWGAVSHFRIQIDTTPPDKFIVRLDENAVKNKKPVVLFNTTDNSSGVEYYKVKVGNGNFVIVTSDKVKSNPYTLDQEESGKYSVLVQAFDRAGNYETSLTEFSIESQEAPKITSYPQTLSPGEPLIVRGTSQPNLTLTLWIEKGANEIPIFYNTRSDENGNFIFVSEEKIDPGNYKIWVRAIDDSGLKSLPSEKFNLLIEQPKVFKLGLSAINTLNIIVPIIGAIVLIVIIFWYFWYKINSFRRRMKSSIRLAEEDVHKIFDELKEDLRDQIMVLEKTKSKRELTKEEEIILNKFKKYLYQAEKKIKSDIEKIEE
ncbi:MAG: hypothetical protein WC705_00560 [Candidatus Paceibacterota bacterium]|jgi:hypothetical protein